jgi:hypothetical protein
MKVLIHKNQIIFAIASIFISPAPQFRAEKSNNGAKTSHLVQRSKLF